MLENDDYLLVNNWQFNPNPDGGDVDFPYLQVYMTDEPGYIRRDFIDLPGAPGQDSKDPPGQFNQHQVLKFDGAYYDPSYGLGPFSSLLELETAEFAGFAYARTFLESGLNVDKNGDNDTNDTYVQVRAQENPPGLQITEEDLDAP
jgi:hypothetical protein